MSISISLPLCRSRTIRFSNMGGRAPAVTTAACLALTLPTFVVAAISLLLRSGSRLELDGSFDLLTLALLARLLLSLLPVALLLRVALLEVGLAGVLLLELVTDCALTRPRPDPQEDELKPTPLVGQTYSKSGSRILSRPL